MFLRVHVKEMAKKSTVARKSFVVCEKQDFKSLKLF